MRAERMQSDEQRSLDCVSYRAEARSDGLGYNHLVHISNQCEFAVGCSVHTNVNPEQMHVRVPPSETRTVLTWRSSPARTFTASVECQRAE